MKRYALIVAFLFSASFAAAQGSVRGGHISGGQIVFVAPSGPPSYPITCTSSAVIAPPTTAPFSGLYGVNAVVLDPEPVSGGNLSGCFHNPEARITDDADSPTNSMTVIGNGSGDENPFNPDSTQIVLTSVGNAQFVKSFNPSTMQVATLYSGSALRTNHGNYSYALGGNGVGVFYSLTNSLTGVGNFGTQLASTTFNNSCLPSCGSAPTPTLVYDYSSSAACLSGKGSSIVWSDSVDLSKDDQTFISAISPNYHITVASGSITITGFSVSGQTISLTNSGTNGLTAGESVLLESFASPNTVLNTQYVTVLSSGLSSTTFQVVVVGSTSGLTSGAGSAVGQFTYDEVVTQAGSGATIQFSYIDYTGRFEGYNVTGTPNAVGIWTGNTSGASFTPSTTAVTGTQGSAVYEVAWNRTKGCIMLNTARGYVTADPGWGIAGNAGYVCASPVNGSCTTNTHQIHNTKARKDGDPVVAVEGTCLTTCNNGIASPFLWDIQNNPLSYVPLCPSSVPGTCGGHWTDGYGSWINDGFPVGWYYRTPATAATPINIDTNLPPNLGVGTVFADDHKGWSNVNTAQTNAFYLTTDIGDYDPEYTPGYAWESEVLYVFPTTGIVKRAAHTWHRAGTGFNAQHDIGAGSPDGRFYMWTSYGDDQLGSTEGDWTGSSHSYPAGSQIMPTVNNPGHYTYYTIAGGTGGTSPPTWSQTATTYPPGSSFSIGGSTTDNTTTWINAGLCIPSGGDYQTSHVYSAGQYVSPSSNSANLGNYTYIITTGGTSGTMPTLFNQTIGQSTTGSGGVVYQNIGFGDCRSDVLITKIQ
jgi:hypothetical protein